MLACSFPSPQFLFNFNQKNIKKYFSLYLQIWEIWVSSEVLPQDENSSEQTFKLLRNYYVSRHGSKKKTKDTRKLYL